jgi:hypothetical protein
MIIRRPAPMSLLRQALDDNAATVLLGPRQIGKSTLAGALAAEHPDSVFLDLEQSSDLRKLQDAQAFLRSTVGKLTIIDEVHRAPELFEMSDRALDPVFEFVDDGIEGTRSGHTDPLRDDWFCATFFNVVEDGIAVIRFIGEDVTGIKACQERDGELGIAGVTTC